MEQRVEEQLQRFQRLKASVHEAVRNPEFGFFPSLASNMLPLASPPAAHPTWFFHSFCGTRHQLGHDTTAVCALSYPRICGEVTEPIFLRRSLRVCGMHLATPLLMWQRPTPR